MVECGGLENRLALFGSRGFESLLLRQTLNRVPATGRFLFVLASAQGWGLSLSFFASPKLRDSPQPCAWWAGVSCPTNRRCCILLSQIGEGIRMNDTKYFSRSWALLTRDKGWIKPILVMSAAALVPIAGEFGNSGYVLEWGRLTAWGVDAAPKQKNVDIGKCVSSGARAFVVNLGFGTAVFIAYFLITLAFSFIPGTLGELVRSCVSIVLSVVVSICNLVILLAQLRCAIYESIGAGYRIDRVFELIGKDIRGFLRVFLVNFVCGLVITAITMVVVVMVILLFVPVVITLSNGSSSDRIAPAMIVGMIVPLVIGGVVFGYVISLLSNAVRLIVTTSMALWLRQFDVPNWGRSEDPLPQDAGPQSTAYYAQQPSAQEWRQPAQQQPPAQQTMQQPPVGQAQQPVQEQRPMQAQQPQYPAQGVAPNEPVWPQQVSQPQNPQVSQPQNPVAQPPTQRLPHRSEPEDLYDSLADAIKDNDRVEGDD